ncbi:MAG: hypothetical protein IT276_10600 [Ignavibacteriaceae bacterium]|nr:hypothetical protein [Ignavibacteriaceae bacterium]
MSISKDQIKIYQLFGDVIIKFVFAASSLIAFWVILIAILCGGFDKATNITLGVLDSLLTITIGVVYGHYFPKKK